MNIRPPTTDELAVIESTRAAYRKMWGALINVPPRAFDGSRDDIRALDFIDYEAGHHPHDLFGAALLWGAVLVNTGAVIWAILDEHRYILVAPDDYPRILIDPYAHVVEIDNTSGPQFGKYEWLLEEVILRLCIQGLSEEVETKLKALLRPEVDGFLVSARQWIRENQPIIGGP